jgi:lipoyl(octanoyl) transferase
VHALQYALLEARKQRTVGDTLLLLEHDPVITLGRGAKPQHLVASRELLCGRGVDVCEVGRGGDITYHGPGQLVGYPIFDLSPDRCDVRRYVGDLLQAMIAVAADIGLGAGRIQRHVGVWVDRASPCRWPGEQHVRDPSKLGAVGVRLSRWVTMHGFAFNASTDLEAFGWIVPCGIREYGVTSVKQLLGQAPPLLQLARCAADHLCERIGAELESFDSIQAPDEQLCAALGASEQPQDIAVG